jgi:phosphoribosylamine--glycine ligase
MRVLVVGSGGREHALAWWLGRSSRVTEVLCAPGNAGTPGRRPVRAGDLDGMVALATTEAVDLVVVGPEAPLVAGLADRLAAAGVPVFGPSAAAARLEGSKAWAKAAMQRWALPAAASITVTDVDAGVRHIDAETRRKGVPPVVKASGLAAGKGVVVADTAEQAGAALRAMLVDGRFGEAGREVVLEERLEGREVSVLAVCSGRDRRILDPAQDHKRLCDHDRGPNTGGMGAFAPSPLPPGLLDQIDESIIGPALAGLEREGSPYLGVLYAGLMLTEAGPRVLEFNCRLGDPETQVVLPLLAGDPIDVLEGALAGRVPELSWRPGAAVGVVMAAAGYPEAARTGQVVTGLDDPPLSSMAEPRGDLGAGPGAGPDTPGGAGCVVFHAGTERRADGAVVTAGGRVLTVTGLGDDVAAAAAQAYAGVARLSFDGAQWRTDIGR